MVNNRFLLDLALILFLESIFMHFPALLILWKKQHFVSVHHFSDILFFSYLRHYSYAFAAFRYAVDKELNILELALDYRCELDYGIMQLFNIEL